MTCREFIMHAAHMCMCCCRVLCAEENRRSSRQVRGSIQRVAWRRAFSLHSRCRRPARHPIPIAYRPSAAAYSTSARRPSALLRAP